MKIFKYVCFFMLFLVFQLAVAQELEEYLVQAAENNPHLKGYFNDYLASLEKIPQVGALPDPQLSFGYFVRPMEFVMGRQRADINLMQMFPWFGMLKAQKDEASQMALMKYNVFLVAKNELFYEIKKVWYDLYMLQREKEIMLQNLDIMKNLENVASVRYRQGSAEFDSAPGRKMKEKNPTPDNMENQKNEMLGMAPSGISAANPSNSLVNARMGKMGIAGMGSNNISMIDLIEIQIEITEMESALESIVDAQRPVINRFNQLVNLPLNQEVTIPEEIFPIEISEEQILHIDTIILKNPMLEMILNEKETYKFKEKMARLEGMPMFGAGVNYMIFSPLGESMGAMGGENMIMPMITMSLPIYRKKYKALQKEAQYLQASAENKWENDMNNLKVELEGVKKEYRDASRKIKLYEKQELLAKHALNIAVESYANGKTGYEDVLRANQQLLNYQIKRIGAVVAQNKAVAMIEMLISSHID